MAEAYQLHSPDNLPDDTAESYRQAMALLNEAGIPYFIGGAYALAYHAGIVRHTKDLDVFLKPADRDRALAVLGQSGFKTEIRYDYWLAKAFHGEDMVDLIYRSPNGCNEITDEWLDRAVSAKVLGVPVKLCSAEHLILSKCYVMNNDRNDLADVMHLLLGSAESLNWSYLLQLFSKHPRLLLAHLIMFGFVYPSEQHLVPSRYIQLLMDRVRSEDSTLEKVCNGTLLSHSQYKKDISENGFIDGRLLPHGNMTEEHVLGATMTPEEITDRSVAQ